MKPTYFFVQTRQPKDNDPGAVEEAHYIIEGDEVVLCDQDGAGLRGENSRRKLKPNEDPRRAASALLRLRVGRKSSDFHRPLRYEGWRF